MENIEVVKNVKHYLRNDKSHTVDLKWFISEKLRLTKNPREVDIIYQNVINGKWFIGYPSHNPNDIAIKYSRASYILFWINTAGGVIGLLGGILGIIAFFR